MSGNSIPVAARIDNMEYILVDTGMPENAPGWRRYRPMGDVDGPEIRVEKQEALTTIIVGGEKVRGIPMRCPDSLAGIVKNYGAPLRQALRRAHAKTNTET